VAAVAVVEADPVPNPWITTPEVIWVKAVVPPFPGLVIDLED
jgi:hypothetical protein